MGSILYTLSLVHAYVTLEERIHIFPDTYKIPKCPTEVGIIISNYLFLKLFSIIHGIIPIFNVTNFLH